MTTRLKDRLSESHARNAGASARRFDTCETAKEGSESDSAFAKIAAEAFGLTNTRNPQITHI
jgi:hypothetical protein